MALYAFDGTWNEEKTNDTVYANTNVARFFDAYHARSGTDDVYEQGIGTKLGAIGHAIGGAFGAGELDRLERAYSRLCQNWMIKNDKIIDLVGFSRGAATCLDFCNLIVRRGIRDPVTHDKRNDTPRFRFVGLFDVVGAFGAGAVLFDLPVFNLGHHLSIPREQIDYCFHAMALDEVRTSFNVIRVAWRARGVVPRRPRRRRRRRCESRSERHHVEVDAAEGQGRGPSIHARRHCLATARCELSAAPARPAVHLASDGRE